MPVTFVAISYDLNESRFRYSVFLNALEKYETHPEDVGECFAEKAEEFKMYVFYCKNKTLSNNLLIEHGATFFSVSLESCEIQSLVLEHWLDKVNVSL